MKYNIHMITAIGAFVVLIADIVLWIVDGFSIAILLGVISMILVTVVMILSIKQKK